MTLFIPFFSFFSGFTFCICFFLVGIINFLPQPGQNLSSFLSLWPHLGQCFIITFSLPRRKIYLIGLKMPKTGPAWDLNSITVKYCSAFTYFLAERKFLIVQNNIPIVHIFHSFHLTRKL